jgi:predicted naringenin-chalcone synthase
MLWLAGDHGLELRLSPELPDTLGGVLPAIVRDFLRPHGLRSADVSHWLVHPGGPQILERTAEALRLPAQALDLSRSILREFGNMSSPTILFIMQALFRQEAGGVAVALAFGPGLTIEMVLLDLGS